MSIIWLHSQSSVLRGASGESALRSTTCVYSKSQFYSGHIYLSVCNHFLASDIRRLICKAKFVNGNLGYSTFSLFPALKEQDPY